MAIARLPLAISSCSSHSLGDVESVLLFVLGVAIFVLGLLVSVGLHELGHLAFAKLFGVRVSQYMIGFGRTLWSFRRGGTEYGIKPILLGGYIAMAGMYPPRHEGAAARDATTGLYNALVQEGRDRIPRAAGAARPAERGEEQRGSAFYLLAPWKRIVVMAAGPVMNLLVGFAIIAVMVVVFGVPRSTTTALAPCVSAQQSQSCAPGDARTPAQAAGLRAGDVILEVDGIRSPTPDQATLAFQRSAGKPVPVVVRRDGREVHLTVTPVPQTRDVLDANGKPVRNADGSTRTTTVGVVGITIDQRLTPEPITSAASLTWQQTGASVGVLATLPQRMVLVWNAAFGGGERTAESPVGLIGVGREIGTVASLSGVPVVDKAYSILGVLASLNISLFVLNLVPLLPLDGGHIAGALWEMLKRGIARVAGRPRPRPVDITRMMPVTLAVVALLGSMTLLLAYADIVHPVNLFG